MPASSPLLLLLLALTSSILFLSPTIAESSAATLNITGILDKARQYKVFIHLLTIETQVATQLENQLNKISTEGLTVFAPTDNAFNSLEPGTLNSLSTQQLVGLLLYHAFPKFYAVDSLLTVGNPVGTLANYGLDFSGHGGGQVNVSTGMVETQVNNNNAVYFDSPLAIYQVDVVLLPPALFQSPATATSPPPPSTKAKGRPPSSSDHAFEAPAPAPATAPVPAPAPAPATLTPAPSSKANTTATAKGPSSSNNDNNGAGSGNIWLSLVVGAVLWPYICMT